MRQVELILAVASLFLASGCTKRTEVITVNPDGAVRLVTEIQADLPDFQQGDAMPSNESGWKVTDRIETKKPDEKKILRVASRVGRGRSRVLGCRAWPFDP